LSNRAWPPREARGARYALSSARRTPSHRRPVPGAEASLRARPSETSEPRQPWSAKRDPIAAKTGTPNRYAAALCPAPFLTIVAAFSAIMIVGAFVLVEVTAGFTEASMTLS